MTAGAGQDSRRWGGGPYNRPLRVVIVTQEDPFYIGAFFRRFLRGAADHQAVGDIRGVMVQPSLGSSSRFDLAGRVWALYGTLGFIRMVFKYAAAKMSGRGIVRYCREAGVEILQFPPERAAGATSQKAQARPPVANNANGQSFLEWIQAEEIDLVVSVSASQIFGKRVLAAPMIGCVNLHNAPLPKYRGMLPNFRQMYHGEAESVLTIHEMVPELDRGDVLLQYRTAIERDMSLERLMTVTKENSATALWFFLTALQRGEATARPLSGEGSYFSWPTRQEAREFRRRGKRVW